MVTRDNYAELIIPANAPLFSSREDRELAAARNRMSLTETMREKVFQSPQINSCPFSNERIANEIWTVSRTYKVRTSNRERLMSALLARPFEVTQ